MTDLQALTRAVRERAPDLEVIVRLVLEDWTDCAPPRRVNAWNPAPVRWEAEEVRVPPGTGMALMICTPWGATQAEVVHAGDGQAINVDWGDRATLIVGEPAAYEILFGEPWEPSGFTPPPTSL